MRHDPLRAPDRCHGSSDSSSASNGSKPSRGNEVSAVEHIECPWRKYGLSRHHYNAGRRDWKAQTGKTTSTAQRESGRCKNEGHNSQSESCSRPREARNEPRGTCAYRRGTAQTLGGG